MMKNTFRFLVGLLFGTQLVLAETHFNAEQADKDFRLAVKSIENKRYNEAVKIFSELASEEIPEAQFNLALLLFNGLGVPKNYKDALFWAWKARLNNHETAQQQVNQIIDRHWFRLNRLQVKNCYFQPDQTPNQAHFLELRSKFCE